MPPPACPNNAAAFPDNTLLPSESTKVEVFTAAFPDGNDNALLATEP